jgi:hypothetical protein
LPALFFASPSEKATPHLPHAAGNKGRRNLSEYGFPSVLGFPDFGGGRYFASQAGRAVVRKGT